MVVACGKVSITLTYIGSTINSDEYVLSRFAGTNRIRGATLHVNLSKSQIPVWAIIAYKKKYLDEHEFRDVGIR